MIVNQRTYRLSLLVTIPVVQPIFVAKSDDMLHLSQSDASKCMVCIGVRGWEAEPCRDGAIEVVFAELLESLDAGVGTLDLAIRVELGASNTVCVQAACRPGSGH